MTEPVCMELGGVRWQVLPQYRAPLFDAHGLRLAEWLAEGRADVVKQGPHRTVYRVALDEVTFYLKHYPVWDLRGWLRQLVRPSKARTEYRRALSVAARGVPTFVPLALGEGPGRFGAGDSFLLTHSLEGAEPLNTFIETTLPRLGPRRQPHVRQALAVELGGLVARMHEAGILHNDLHAANLLIRLGEDDRPILYLIDLSAVRLGEALDWKTSHANLVMVNRWFTLRAGRADRMRFWEAYCRERSPGLRAAWSAGVLGATGGAQPERLTLPALADDLERHTWASCLTFWRGRDGRCLEKHRHYRQVQTPATTGHAVSDLERGTLEELAADPDGPFTRPGVKLLKDSRSSTVVELEVPVNGTPRRVIYKRFRVTSWADPLANLLRRSPALRSWVHGHGLRERFLPTARPLLVLHRKARGLPREGYLLTEKLEGAADLHSFLAALASLPRRERLAVLRRRIELIARLVRELHRRQLSQRDLKATNLLTTLPAVEGEQAWFIDLAGLEAHRRLPHARRLQNLGRLNASFHDNPALTRTDRLRFLRVYLNWGLHGRGDWKRWWRAIARATRAKVARNLRSGRPLS
ncbi:MAG: lipopolysaccharide kinase InaA family protein [Gemmataceae bacterium]|nr:lipopolysaccharide kinase InaA family protein [Gemmataceae bacterium]